MLFHLLGNQKQLLRFCVASNIDLREKKAEVVQAPQKLLNRVKVSKELKITRMKGVCGFICFAVQEI